MPLRVYAQANVVISQDNSANPQEISFSSGNKSKADTATYSESAGNTFDLAAGATDIQIPLGSLTAAELIYLFTSASGLLLKLVPVGGALGSTAAMELIAGFPAVVPFKIKEIYASNPGASAAKLIVGAAGN